MAPVPVDIYQNGKPWPGYFLVRTTGEVVPLIAVDELPHSVDVVGVPRSLDLEETIGMLNLGLQQSPGCCYRIFQKIESKTQVSERVGKANKSSDIPSPLSSPPKSPQGSINASNSTRSSITRVTTNSTASQGPTQLCRHWCTHGMCKWGQQCRYRHIMPMTLHGLQEVGLVDWPVWFRKENPGYFVCDSRGGGVPGRIGRGRRVVGNGTVSAGTCCGPQAVNGVEVKSERLRENRRVAVRERASGKVLRSEELGEQIIERLRGMSKEGKVGGGKVGNGGGGGGNAMIERVAARDTKNWEDESDDDTDDEEEEKAVANGKLVDVS